MTAASSVAHEALALGKENKLKIDAHEDLCAERYGHINGNVAEIKSILKWAGTTAFGIIVVLLGFLLKTTWEAKEQASAAASTKIEMLQQQLSDSRRPIPTAPPQ